MIGSAIVRLVLVNCSGLLGDIVRDALREQPDITVVSALEDASQLVEVIRDARPDVVLWNRANEHTLAGSLDFFAATPTVRVLATLDDGRDAALWELRPHRTPLGQLSPGSLVARIREAVAR